MFEARLTNGSILKKLIESLKDLVNDANIDCSEEGLSIQAMDSSHVSLCAVALRADGFDHFRCDRDISLGFSSANLSKILKCADNGDVITLKAEDTADSLTLMFESANQDRISDFELKLMDIDADHLGIPDTEYKTTIRMPSAEFQRIIRDLQVLGDTCVISCTKEGVRFSVTGDLGTGNVLVRANAGVDKDEKDQVVIEMDEPVELTFALRYLNFFTKATTLGPVVVISMSPDVPIVVEYPIEQIGHIKYYLAPKIDDNED
jgi:proliferating cell nuclear antigen